MTEQQIIAEVVYRDMEITGVLRRIAKQHDTGGQQREKNGKGNELMFRRFMLDVGRLVLPSSDVRVLWNPSGRREDAVRYRNEKGGSLDVCLDLHMYVDGRFVLAVESKSYIDATMAKSALFNTIYLKKAHPDVKCVILAVENALGDEAQACLLNEGMDGIFALTPGKRAPYKPRHTFLKPISEDLCMKFVNFLKRDVLLPTLETDDETG